MCLPLQALYRKLPLYFLASYLIDQTRRGMPEVSDLLNIPVALLGMFWVALDGLFVNFQNKSLTGGNGI